MFKFTKKMEIQMKNKIKILKKITKKMKKGILFKIF